MSMLGAVTQVAGATVNTGTYISITDTEAKRKYLAFLQHAEQRILNERIKRREGLQEIATALVLAEKIRPEAMESIQRAFNQASKADHQNQLINKTDESPNDLVIGFNYKKGYERIYVKSGGKTEELGEFMIKHGAYSYSKKLKQLGALIATTNSAIAYNAALNLDIATLTMVEFINSTAFDRYNNTYKDLINQAAEAAIRDTVEETCEAAR